MKEKKWGLFWFYSFQYFFLDVKANIIQKNTW
jgi:hypothetical protein